MTEAVEVFAILLGHFLSQHFAPQPTKPLAKLLGPILRRAVRGKFRKKEATLPGCALRCDKATLAALAATLKLYRDPDRLAVKLPTLGRLARNTAEIRLDAEAVRGDVIEFVGTDFTVTITDCAGQIGSGALPVESLDSAALTVTPNATRGRGAALKRLAARFRTLPVPVIGRVQDDAFWLDLRCLDDIDGFRAQLSDEAGL